MTEEQLGVWIGQLAVNINLKTEPPFRDLARQIRGSLVRKIRRSEMFTAFQLLRPMIGQAPGEFVKVIENSRPYVEVSNLGRLPLPVEYGELRLTELHFAVGIADSQAGKWGVTVDAVTFNDTLHLNIVLLATCWTEVEAQALLDQSIEILRCQL